MNKLVIAAIAAMFSFAVHAAPEKAAAPAAPAASKHMTKEECAKAMGECKDEACKEKLRNESNCI